MNTSFETFSTRLDLTSIFRGQTEKFADFLAKEGVFLKPYLSPELHDFAKLDGRGKSEAVRVLGQTLDVFVEVIASGDNLRDTPQLLWRSLRKLGWIPRSDSFDKIADGDVVEIYSHDHIGLFRNLAFYEGVSYSVETLFSRPWFELTTREPQRLSAEIYELARQVLSGERNETISVDVGTHLCLETCSPEMLQVSLTLKFISPLYANGKIAGLLACSQMKVVGRGLSGA